MADRKQFSNVPCSDPAVKALLEKAKSKPVTDEQLREQRISFAFGNAPVGSTLITKEIVRQASKHIRLNG